MFGGLPEPHGDLNPVAIRLWRKVPRRTVSRSPCAARQRGGGSGDGPELPAHQPSVLTAAIHPMAGYRAGEAGITHDALPRVTATESGEITPLLQARLRLSPEQPWQRVYHPVDVRQDRDDAGEEDAGEGAGAADGGG